MNKSEAPPSTGRPVFLLCISFKVFSPSSFSQLESDSQWEKAKSRMMNRTSGVTMPPTPNRLFRSRFRELERTMRKGHIRSWCCSTATPNTTSLSEWESSYSPGLFTIKGELNPLQLEQPLQLNPSASVMDCKEAQSDEQESRVYVQITKRKEIKWDILKKSHLIWNRVFGLMYGDVCRSVSMEMRFTNIPVHVVVPHVGIFS